MEIKKILPTIFIGIWLVLNIADSVHYIYLGYTYSLSWMFLNYFLSPVLLLWAAIYGVILLKKNFKTEGKINIIAAILFIVIKIALSFIVGMFRPIYGGS